MQYDFVKWKISQYFGKWKTTLIFIMEDDLQIETDTISFLNGRQPKMCNTS